MPGKTFKSVWDAIADTPEQAANLKLRSSLMDTLIGHIQESGLSQTTAAAFFGITQPRISDLVRGKIDLFSIDSLVNMIAVAGLSIELRVVRARKPTPATFALPVASRKRAKLRA